MEKYDLIFKFPLQRNPKDNVMVWDIEKLKGEKFKPGTQDHDVTYTKFEKENWMDDAYRCNLLIFSRDSSIIRLSGSYLLLFYLPFPLL